MTDSNDEEIKHVITQAEYEASSSAHRIDAEHLSRSTVHKDPTI